MSIAAKILVAVQARTMDAGVHVAVPEIFNAVGAPHDFARGLAMLAQNGLIASDGARLWLTADGAAYLKSIGTNGGSSSA
jgi:hypothetical protein